MSCHVVKLESIPFAWEGEVDGREWGMNVRQTEELPVAASEP